MRLGIYLLNHSSFIYFLQPIAKTGSTALLFAVSVLIAFMINAGTSTGCSRSNAPAAASADTATAPATSSSAPAPPRDEEMHFPASKAGTMSPRKGK